MMRVPAILLSLALSISQASAGGLINSQRFGVSLTFQGCTFQGGPLTTYTFSAHAVGPEGNRDTIVVVLAVDGTTVFSTSSVTVGGASATEVIDEDGTGIANTSLHIVDNPSGTAEDIVVTMSEATVNGSVCVWAAYDLSSETAVASTADDDTAAGELILDLSSTTAAGIAIGGCNQTDSPETATWAGLIAQTSTDRSAAQLVPTLGGALTVRCDWSGSSDASGVAASFR